MLDTAGCPPCCQLSDVTMALRSLLASIVSSSVGPVTPSIQCKQVTRNTFRYIINMRTELCVALALLGMVMGRPQKASEGLQDSISSVLRTLSVEDEAPRTRPRIITKYDFMQTRDKKSHLDLPPEFVISTDLQVSHQARDPQAESSRAGRSHGLFGSSRRAKTGFSDLASAVRNAPVVTGVRLPDDESDLVVHRGGRFINNKYVPDSLQVPREMVVRAELGPGGPRLRTGRSYQATDYTFSPLQHYEQQQQLQRGLPTVLEADQDDFVIQEQTYKMCPTCPTFSVPVPIPKTNDFYQEKSEEKSIFSRIAEMVSPAIETAREFFNRRPESSVDTISSRLDSGLDTFQHGQPGENKLTTPLLTGLAAVGFGITSFLTSRLAGPTGRQFEDEAHHLLNSIDHELDSLSQSEVSVEEILCLPRQVCDRLKSKKHLLASYPNMKAVASWLTEKYFQNVAETSSDYYSHGQCNIKHCLLDLLN